MISLYSAPLAECSKANHCQVPNSWSETAVISLSISPLVIPLSVVMLFNTQNLLHPIFPAIIFVVNYPQTFVLFFVFLSFQLMLLLLDICPVRQSST